MMKKLAMNDMMDVIGGCCQTCSITYSTVSVNGNTPVCVETTTCVDKYGHETRTVNQVNAAYCPSSPNVPN